MLPGPRVTIGPSQAQAHGFRGGHSSRPPSECSRRRQAKPPIAPSRAAATSAPTRRSFEGLSSSTSSALSEPALDDALATHAAAAHGVPPGLAHSVSAASLSSEADLALLLGGGSADAAGAGSSGTTLVFGSLPPVVVRVPSPASAAAAAAEAAAGSDDGGASAGAGAAADHAAAAAAGSETPSKLSAASQEFYPAAYLGATALAAASASLSSRAQLEREAPDAQHCDGFADGAAASVQQQQQHQEQQQEHQEQPLEQLHFVAVQQQEQEQQQHGDEQHEQFQAAAAQQQWAAWHAEQQQQQWAAWHAAQAAHQAGHHGGPPPQQQQFAMPMFLPVFVPPFQFAYGPQQLAMVPMVLPHPAGAGEHGAGYEQPQQQQPHALAPPPSPGGRSLPADTCSLLSTPTAPGGWAHSSLYGSSHSGGGSASRPGSSAGSVSGYSVRSSRRGSDGGAAAPRDAGTVTVSGMSCVKDAAGALAKVVSRHGSCTLLSLGRPGDAAAAAATCVAAKSLAVARFYVNTRMRAGGAAGVEAAAALTGVDVGAADAAAAAPPAAAVEEELVFMPYHRRSSGGAAAAGDDGGDGPLGFVVAKAAARDLPAALPPPVGVPACLQGTAAGAAAAAGGQQRRGAGAPPLLKAGAHTDVNKLSNAIIHNVLGGGHVALQLAGAAACHVAMRALVKARARLVRKFQADIVATASFANEDTSTSIGRATVFLRLDVMRSSLLQQLSACAAAAAGAVAGAAREAAAQPQQPQPALA